MATGIHTALMYVHIYPPNYCTAALRYNVGFHAFSILVIGLVEIDRQKIAFT